ncbi:hypothetical protein JCM4814A_42160 [Streptomyces phaeofaciens JCM 4814]|uniref:Uncharacterized protein n=1 Tax=Streptomyces phaeofaciens TaxID=68254 RepID=A0A918HNX0_9ACTN|nr:hypothetical protein [Streptomyces phaeofaciens]GGT87115.1 hypothetical protein GCM10010226_76950 [Streptomyces phaeofaciens]
MAAAQNGNEGVWRVLTGVGALGVGIGLIAGVPILSLLGAPLAIVGVIGLTAARRK